MYGLSEEDVMEIYELTQSSKEFKSQLSVITNKVAPLGAKLANIAPEECRTVSNLMKLGFITSAEILRYDTLAKHNLLTEALAAELQFVELFKQWLPHLSQKLTKNSRVIKLCGETHE